MTEPPAPGGGQGQEPGRGEGLPGGEGAPGGPVGGGGRDPRLAGFVPGGAWHGLAPGPELAAVLAAACGPDWACPGAEPGELIGVLRRCAALESWASAAKLGVIRELIRADDLPLPGRPRRGAAPGLWSDSLTHEVAVALASSVQSADKIMWAARDLGSRLPGTGRALADGTLTLPKARLITETFEGLSDQDAARAEEILLPQLAGTTGKTYAQIERLAAAIAAQVDPELAQRQREAAERHRSRVQMFRERSGTAALSGRDLPTDETLAAYANVNARAREYQESGAFPGGRMDQLRATAYLDLLNGITAGARIAHALATAQAGADRQADPGGWPGPCDPRDCSCGERDGCCADPGDDGPGDSNDCGYGGGPGDDEGPENGGFEDGDPGGDSPQDGGPFNSGSDDAGPGHAGPGHPGPSHPGPSHPGPGHPGPGERGQDPDAEPGGRTAVADLIIPLLTLLGLAQRPGQGHGLGPLDPGLCHDLAATAARWPASQWCLTITDPAGIAIGHGCAKAARPGKPDLPGRAAPGSRGQPPDHRRHPPPPASLAALPARVNLTIPLAALHALRRAAPLPAPWGFAPRSATGPGPGPGEGYGSWVLTLPGGRDLAVTLETVPSYSCDHRHESRAYQPNGTLRHLVQVRDGECTFPPCSRHARESDFEHGVPYHQGGRTCACNAGARSRRCHRVKQSPGWHVTQPRPGWHQWTTPAGWTYTQGPKQYPA